MKTILKYLVIALMVVISTMSCTETEILNDTQQGRYQSVLKFKVAQSVRGIGGEDEINRMDIFLFKDDVLEKIIPNITSFDTTTDGYGTITINSDNEGERKAFVVANIDNPSLILTLKVGVTTTEDMKNIKTSLLTKMANPPLVMYGIGEDISFSDLTNTSILKLYRVVARIDVVNLADNFVLTDARLINSRQSSFIFPGKVSSDASIKDFDKIDAIGSKVSLYSYENLQLVDDSATSVEISGTVNGAPLTYKIDLEDKSERFPLERNYQYTINVNNVRQNNINFNISVRPWIIGDEIEETVEGTLPVIVADIDPAVGIYDSVNKLIEATMDGGNVIFETQANAECGIEIADSWIKLSPTTKASSINTLFKVNIEPNTQPDPRTTTIRFFNRINDKSLTITVTQGKAEVLDSKYMVLVVAGQSNAVGYDESNVYPDGADKPNPRAFQLSYRYGTTNPSITQLSWCSENLQDMTSLTNAGGQKGTKGIHLPLANELLKRLPSDYKLLIIPVAYGGTSLLSASNQSMGYNVGSMQPDVMTATLQWGVGRPYNKTMVDRVKSILSDNPNNKFLGVVWCQGENDAIKSEAHYAAFNTMTKDFFVQINAAGYGSRCPKGVADKDMWYNYSSTKFWSDWYLPNSNSSSVFGGYKVWNPNTFIHVPFNTDTNEINGNGISSSTRSSHFGNDAFRKVIAPMVAECMDNNGGLFNGNAPRNNRFIETNMREDANSLAGSLNDADLKNGLKAFYSLNGSYAPATPAAFSIRQAAGASFTNSTGIVDIAGIPRRQSAFNVSSTSRFKVTADASIGDWSIAFMFKRTGSFSNDSQAIISGLTNTPFIGFKKYPKNGGAGNYAEFVVEPIPGSDPLKAVAGQFMDADNVRTPNDWIHYVITYKVSSKTVTIYMNGLLVAAKSLPSTPQLNMSTFNIGAANGAIGEIFNFGIWSNVLTDSTVKKLYLYSYYGFTK